MLRIKDKEGKLVFLWNDEDEEPVSIDDLILQDDQKENDNAPQKSVKPAV